MGFFDTWEDIGGGNYIGKEEKEELIKGRIPFPILKVQKGKNPFGEGDRYVVTTELEGEQRVLGFNVGAAASRDRFLDAVAEYLETEGAEPVVVIFERVGKAVLIRDPNAEPISTS